MRIAITSNGPGEFSGWVRPLVSTLRRLAPDTRVSLFFVPDDYATGREPELAARLFPEADVISSREYVRFALGKRPAHAPVAADVVQYLGGDLMHAQRVRARLHARGRAYKFGSRRIAREFDGAFAIDAANAAEFERAGFEPGRVSTVGNLAIDGALAEASGAYPASEGEGASGVEPGGVLVMPGARRHEIANLVPFFLRTAVHLRALRPALPIAFALSPFTSVDEVADALRLGGRPTVWGARGTVVSLGDGIGLVPEGGGPPFPVVRDAMRHAARAKLVVTIPGTKCIEVAALGVPAMVCVPLNAPEVVVTNGALQYVDRIPIAGRLLKRAVIVAVDARFTMTAQPNIDSGEFLMPELRGTLMPAETARRIAAYADDDAARARDGRRLAALYAHHAGAAERMARALLEAYA